MEDRRRHKRFRVDIMDIHGKILFASNITILNISIGGILLKADRRLNIGRDYILKLESKGHYLTLKGKIVRSTLSDSQRDSHGDIVPIYTSGLQFIDLSTEKVNEIATFIQAHVIDYESVEENLLDVYKLSGLRLYVRFHIENPEKSTIHFHDSYTVKKISLSGMLIESGEELDKEENIPMELSIPGAQTISLTGRVVSCKVILNTHPEVYEIGLEFVDISDEDRAVIIHFLNTLPQNQTRRSKEV